MTWFKWSNKNDLLIGCGRLHVKGIVKNISKDPRVKKLEKIKDEIPEYNSKIAPIPKIEPVYAY